MKTRMNKQHAGLALAGFAAVTTAGALIASMDRPTAEEDRRSPLTGVAAGTRRVYDVDLDTRLMGEDQPIGHYHVTGRFVVQADQPGTVLAYVDGAKMTSSFAKDGDEGKMITAAADLAAPVQLAVGGDGLIAEVRENPGVTVQARTLVKSIAAYSQFDHSARGARWSESESDASGTYEARYTRLGGGRFQREKLAYSRLNATPAGSQGELGLEVEASRHEFRFAADGHLETLVVDETLAGGGQLTGGLGSVTRMTLRFVGEEPATAPAVPRDQLIVVRETAVPAADAFSPEADERRLAGRDFADLVTELDGLPPLGERNQEEARAGRVIFIGLAAAMRLDDANVAEALALVRDHSPHASTLWDALASSGTPAAQAALREIIAMPGWSKAERRAQMVGLSLVGNPTDDTLAFLHTRFDDPDQGTQARYAMGTAVHNLKERRPEAAEKTLDVILAELASDADVDHRAALLIALGNAGHPRALDTVTGYLAHKDAELRRAAVRGLRLLEGAAVESLIIRAASEDAAVNVRLEGVAVLGSREPSGPAINALVEIYENDGSAAVRRAAETELEKLAAGDPEIARQLNAREDAKP